MSRPLTVLKLGGSVLADSASLESAVQEIYRWHRRGDRVIAVVSALQGVTDALFGEVEAAGSASEDAVATYLATGEQRSAALLTLALDRAGVAARVLLPDEIGLAAEGERLDARPARVDGDTIRAALQRTGVAVVPGYSALHGKGGRALLGRGGSDLTALFLAQHLGATRCRLVKDVDGLYDRDPRGADGQARRYEHASWADALATDGSILQHKAVRFAAEHGLGFEVAGLSSAGASRVGRGASRLRAAPRPFRPLRVALLGLGTVGQGVARGLLDRPDLFELDHVVVRALHGPRPLPRFLLGIDALEAAGRDVDVVVEALGGLQPATAAIERALLSGAHVVTANKAVLAAQGPRLRDLARTQALVLADAAAVGGSMPLLERLARTDGRRLLHLRAILNGTSNFVLGQLALGRSLSQACDDARARGFAEQDTSRDLSGRDAAEKLCVIAQHLGAELSPADVPCMPLDADHAERVGAGADDGTLKQVATLHRGANGTWSARVALRHLPGTDPLASVTDEGNATELHFDDGHCERLHGRGAGQAPTSTAVLADLFDIARHAGARPSPHGTGSAPATAGAFA